MKIKLTFNLADIVFLLFIVITFFFIVVGADKVENFRLLILVRIFTLLFVFILLYISEKNSSKILFLIRQFYPLIFTAYFYGETGYYNNILFDNLDPFFIQIESAFFNGQPSLLFSAKYNGLWFSELMNFSYFCFYLLIIFTPLIIYFKANSNFDRYYFILILSFYTYYLIFALFPVVGPQFHFPVELRSLPNSGFFHNIMVYIQEKGETPTGAFPSSHVGISWIIVILVYKSYPKLLYIVLIISISICFSTVFIKAHYLIDVIGGLISAPILYYLANKLFNRFRNEYLLSLNKSHN